MSVEEHTSPSNNENHSGTPGLATRILTFCLPQELREPILGDLEEEFVQRLHRNTLLQVQRWYWWQAIQSAFLFIWQQRGTVMTYLISVVFFLFMIALAIFTADNGLSLISVPTLILVVPTSFALGIGATSFKAAKLAFKLSFSDTGNESEDTSRQALRFLQVTGNQFLFVAGLGFFLSAIMLMFILARDPELMSDPLRYSRYAFVMLPLLYGFIFKCLFYSAEQKLAGKYFPD